MFQKIKNIKKYIKIAKIGGIVFMIVFLLLLAYNFYQAVHIYHLEKRINLLEENIF